MEAYPAELRRGLAGLLAICLPRNDMEDGKWSQMYLEAAVSILNLDHSQYLTFLPLLVDNSESQSGGSSPSLQNQTTFQEQVEGWVHIFPEGPASHDLLRDFVVLSIVKLGYDARARVALRRCCHALGQPWGALAALEAPLGRALGAELAAARAHAARRGKWRAAKVGAAALGGGALLAVTGGLAAPAIAAGVTALGITGLTTVAALMTTYSVAVIFGVSGGGLAGYKMARRTKDVKEFRFDLATAGTGMSLFVCISGWCQQRFEFFHPWGIDSSEQDLLERLHRYFDYHNDPKTENEIVQLLELNIDKKEDLWPTLKSQYGTHPMEPLRPRPRSIKGGGINLETQAEDELKIEELVHSLITDLGLVSSAASVDSNIMTEESKHSLDDSEDISVDGKGQEWPSDVRSSQQISRGFDGDIIDDINDEEKEEDVCAIDQVVEPEEEKPYPGGDVEDVLQERQIKLSLPGEEEQQDSSSGIGKVLEQGLPVPAGQEQSPLERTDDEDAELLMEAVEEVDASGVKKIPVWWWKDLGLAGDVYTVSWEFEMLRDLGKSVQDLVYSATSSAVKETLKYTLFYALITALTWPLLMVSVVNGIDDKWTIACKRADQAGKILADALVKREQGARPVTLVGYSMGARVVVACLEELGRRHAEQRALLAEAEGRRGRRRGAGGLRNVFAGRKKKDKKATEADLSKIMSVQGIVENVVLMGVPIPADAGRFQKISKVVAGRFVHCYSRKDWVLAFLYRYKELKLKCAGNKPVNCRRVESVDLTGMITRHLDYPKKIAEILALINLDDGQKYADLQTI